MITRSRINQLMAISLPIMGGMVSGNLLSLVDTAMVGSLGMTAIAAAGVAGFAISLVFATFSSLASATQAITARRIGEGKPEEATHALHSGLVISTIIGVVVSAVLIPLIPSIFPILSDDADVLRQGIPYMQISLIGLMGSCINTSLAGYWNGLGKTVAYTNIMMTSHLVNILLNYVFIFGFMGIPAYGVAGAAIATTLSIYLTTIAYFVLLIKHHKPPGFLKLRLPPGVLKRMVNLMVPMSGRSVLQYAGYLIFTVLMGKIGTLELAATTILVRIMLITFMPVFGMGLGGATLAAQRLGAKEPEEATQWGWDTAKIGAIISFIVGLPLIFFPGPILSILVDDAATVALSVVPLQVIGLTRPLYIVFIFATLLITMGEVKRPTYFQLGTQWLLFLPAVWFFSRQADASFLLFWILEASNIALQLAILAWLWKQGNWQKVRV